MNEVKCCYCQVMDSNGYVSNHRGYKDLFNYETKCMGNDIGLYACIEDGKLMLSAFEYDPFFELEIKYCPMCGRKL